MAETEMQETTGEQLSPAEQLHPGALKEALREVADSLEIPSRPLFGALPLKRVIPQDVHSVADYANGLLCAAALLSSVPEARKAGAALSASVISVSLFTDYRLSVANVIPIEAHEVIDYLWGASAIAAPFVFGYSKKCPLSAACHVATGAFTILASLFTDYRAAKGAGHSRVESAAMMGARLQPGLSEHMEYSKG